MTAMTNLRQQQQAVGERGSRIFYGWWIVGSGFIVNTFNGALVFHSFGAYVVLLEQDFGWSQATFGLAFALQRIESGLLGPIEGWAIDRFGPRKVMMTGLVIFAIGFLALSQINSILTFYLAYLLIALGSVLGSFLPVTVAVVNWFNKRRALALALVSLGFAAGGLIQPGVVALLESLGWRGMAAASGIFVLIIGLPLAAVVRHRPEDYGMLMDGEVPVQGQPPPPPERDFTTGQALRTSAFWLIALGHSSSLLVIGAVMVYFASHLTLGLGYSLAFFGLMSALMTTSMVIGQVGIGGLLGDRLNKRLVIIIAMCGHTVAMLLLAFSFNVVMVIGFVVINGLAMGTRGPLIQAMRADYFGRASFGKIMGFSSMVMMAGMIIGPVVAGISYDLTGSYQRGFVILAILALSGGVFFAFAKKPELPADTRAPAPTPFGQDGQFAVATNGAAANGAAANGASANGALANGIVTHTGMAETVEVRDDAWAVPAAPAGGNGAGAPAYEANPSVPSQQR